MNNADYADIAGTFNQSNYKKAKLEIKFKNFDRLNFAQAAKIAIKIPSPIEQILTMIVIRVAIKNSSPHPKSPKISFSNLNI